MAALRKQERGFSLVELVVALGVMVLVLAMTLANFPKLRDQIALTLATRELALTIRKTQSYAIAVREFDSNFPVNLCNSSYDPSQGNVRYPPYGVSLSKTIQADGRDPMNYIIFGDIQCAITRGLLQIYAPAFSPSELVSTVRIQNGAQISAIEGYFGGPTPVVLDAADIVYQRPSPSVTLVGYDGASSAIYQRIEISLTSGNGSVTQKIIVRPTGQISIQ